MPSLIRWWMLGIPLLLVACSGQSIPAIEPAPENAATAPAIEVTAFADIAPLATPQEEADRLPDAVAVDRVDPSSTRLLGAQGNQRYWVAAGEEPGDICAISMIQVGDRFIAGTGCGTFLDFRTRGISILSRGMSQFAYALVIPDGYAADARRKLDEALVAPNLIAFDSQEALASTIEAHGRELRLAHDSDEDKADLELVLSAP